MPDTNVRHNIESGTFEVDEGPCVRSTAGTCICSSNYNAYECEDGERSTTGKYGGNERCSIRLTKLSMLHVPWFHTESYDKLRVTTRDGELLFSGSTEGPNMVVTSGPISWSSDASSTSR